MEALSTIFTGDLAIYRDTFVFSDPDRPCVPARDLLEPASFDRIVTPFVARYPGADRRAVISFWTQWYFGALVAPSVAANLLLDLELPLALDEVGVLLHEDEHRPTGFRLPHHGYTLETDVDVFERFHGLVRRHLEPLIDAVAESSGLATRLLWSNAGSYFDWIVRQISRSDGSDGSGRSDPLGTSDTSDTPMTSEEGKPGSGFESPGMRYLNSRLRPDGSKNPLFRPVRAVNEDGQEVLQRRICCLRYLLPGVDDCGSRCPLGS